MKVKAIVVVQAERSMIGVALDSQGVRGSFDSVFESDEDSFGTDTGSTVQENLAVEDGAQRGDTRFLTPLRGAYIECKPCAFDRGPLRKRCSLDDQAAVAENGGGHKPTRDHGRLQIVH